jgi:hypothetical protein
VEGVGKNGQLCVSAENEIVIDFRLATVMIALGGLQMDGCMDGWTDGRTDGWMDGRMDGWMDRRMDGWMDPSRHPYKVHKFTNLTDYFGR